MINRVPTTLGVALAVAGTCLVWSSQAADQPPALTAAPHGSPTAAGTAADPTTVQAALDRAEPGQTIQLAPGVYRLTRPLTTRRAGQPGRPITLRGPERGLDLKGRNRAVVTGAGHLVDIEHSHYRLDGFTLNGQPGLDFAQIPTSPDDLVRFKDRNQSKIVDSKLVYVGVKGHHLTDVRINNMFLTGAGGECVRMRNLTTGSTVSDSLIYRCGFLRKDKEYGYHNGEGVYLGTSPKSTEQPYARNDATNGNRIERNVIRTYASECVNIKENAADNVVLGNVCEYGLGPASANESVLEVRGRNNQVVGNTIGHSRGFGVKFWSDAGYGAGGNVLAGNTFADIASTTITVSGQSQPAEVCETRYPGGKASTAGLKKTDIARKCSKKYPTSG